MAAGADKGELTRVPSVWALLGLAPGDNGQVLALAEAVGWPFETRQLAFRRSELLASRLLGVTLLGLDPARSDPLRPPWPELIVTAGRRNEPVAGGVQPAAGGVGALPSRPCRPALGTDRGVRPHRHDAAIRPAPASAHPPYRGADAPGERVRARQGC